MTPQINNKINRSIKRYWLGSNRRWGKYNESLVDRIEYLADLSFIKDNDRLLEEKNNGKIIPSYCYLRASRIYNAIQLTVNIIQFRFDSPYPPEYFTI